MILTADEIARSLSASWDLLNRRVQSVARFEFGEAAFRRSFRAPLVAAPVFVIWLAADRAAAGAATPLFENAGLLGRAGVDFAALWLTLPFLAVTLADRLQLWPRMRAFVIVCNWSSLLAAAMLAVPALLLAIGWATPALASLFAIAAALLIMRMRWVVARATLGVTAGVATLLAIGDGLIGMGLLRLVV